VSLEREESSLVMMFMGPSLIIGGGAPMILPAMEMGGDDAS
jgi:hypothetical protein